MPGQKSAEKAPVHVSIRRDLIHAARARLEAEGRGTTGRTMTELVEHALIEYAAGRFTLPPPSPGP